MRRLGVGLAFAAWVLFLAACFLPAVTTIAGWEVNLEGWLVAIMSIASVDDLGDTPLLAVLTVLASLTNLVMLASPWAIYRARNRGARVFVIAGCLAAAVNVAVFAAWRASEHARFGPGYVIWLLSFIFITAALQVTRVSRARLSPRVA